MTLFQAVFLAIIQGLTEFLPISSSGHLVIFQKIFGLKPPVLFDILVHVGTLGAVLIFFRDRLRKITVGLFKKDRGEIDFLWLIIIGSIPAVFVGLLLQTSLEVIFDSLKLVGFSLLVTGIFLLSTKFKLRGIRLGRLNRSDAFFIGLFQALAILPGVSRSGSTISAGLWRKLRPEKALEFSFLLAIPAIIGALVLEMPVLVNTSTDYLGQGILGMIIAGLIGYWALKTLSQILVSEKFWLFGVYCLGLGLFWLFSAYSG
jgi:undecaprenyl-diphosphatase